MSRLAQAGLSSTASPGAACAKHQATAASSVAWRCSGSPPRPARARLRWRGVAADRGHGARVALHRRGQRREVLALAVAAQDDDQLGRRLVGTQAVQRGDGGADVGALAVVEGLDVVDRGDPLARGAARRRSRAGRAASAPAGSRWRWPAPARPARWRRCGGRARAARRPASGAAGGSLLPRPSSASRSRRPAARAPARPCRFR